MKNAIFFSNLFLTLLSFQLVQAQTETILVHSDEPSDGLYIISDVNKEKFGYARYDEEREIYVEVIPEKYEDAHDVFHGLAQVKQNGKWGAIDINEKTIIPFKYDYMRPFSESYLGLAWVSMNNKQGYINTGGREIIPVKYDDVDDTYKRLDSVELLAVKNNGKWGALNGHGREVIYLKYDLISYGYDDMIPAVLNDKWGVLDRTGETIIPFQYDHITAVGNQSGWLEVQLNEKYGLLNKDGDIVVPLNFDNINSHPEVKMILIELNGKWGFYNERGKEVIAPKFEKIPIIINGFFNVTENGNDYLIDSNGVPQREYVKYFWNNDAQIEIQGQYDENWKKTGEWKEYYANGQLKNSHHYLNDKKHGVFKRYYEDGTLWMHLDKYVNDKYEGQWKSYHNNGKPWTFVQYARDKKNGEFINYYDNGNVERRGIYTNDEETGEWKFYNEDGSLKETKNFN